MSELHERTAIMPSLVLAAQQAVEELDITFDTLSDENAWVWRLSHPNLEDKQVTFSLIDDGKNEIISFAATIRDADSGDVEIDKPGILITMPTAPFIRKTIAEYIYAVARGDLG